MVPIEAWLAEAREFRQSHGRPLVTLSYAQSLDGSISLRRGVSTELSGPQAMRLTHCLRAAHAAILVGIGTVLSDDPRLTVRLVQGRNPQPVVLDGQLRFPLQAKLLDGEPRPWIATRQQPLDPESHQQKIAALEGLGARIFALPSDENGNLSLPALLATLADIDIDSLMVEGGARVITNFLSNHLVDQFVITIAPVFLGGLPAIQRSMCNSDPSPLNPSRMQTEYLQDKPTGFPTPQDIGYDQLGDDLIVWGRLT
jgi:3,4-dihydroxy 2-butanone 4-phosphate synthase/GTP cyclohydrolase II